MALSIITVAADVTSLTLSIKDKADKSASAVTVQIGVGQGLSFRGDTICTDCGGSQFHIEIWNEFGVGYGEATPKKGANIAAGAAPIISVSPGPYVDNPSSQQPEYVMLTMENDDGICLSYVIASGNSAQWTLFGDLGYKCGADWYNSNQKVGDGTYTPKCVWLDKNHSNGLHYSGLALHMPDFAGDEQGKIDEYQEDPDTLCKSTRRMGFFPSMPDDGLPPFFLPPLNYTSTGADVDFNYVKDRPNSRIRRGELQQADSRLQRRDTSNPRPGHLIVSDNESPSAHELCESESSFGPDFVSTIEDTYCDMSAKKAYPLCDQSSVKEDCFDLDEQALRGSAGLRMQRGQGVPKSKKYVTTEHWEGTAV